MSNVYKYALRLIFSTILIVYGTSPYLLLIFVPLSAGWWVLQKYYRASARELQRLSSISRSPIYSAFNESLNGAATVQAFGDVERVASEQCERFDYNQRASTQAGLSIPRPLWLVNPSPCLLLALVLSLHPPLPPQITQASPHSTPLSPPPQAPLW